jgi:hypothetical protein
MRRSGPSVLLCSLLASLGALPASAGEASPSRFGPGEQSTYRVAYLGVRAGTAQITVGSAMSQWGKQVWPIVTLAKTENVMSLYPVKDKFVTYWDMAENRTIGSDLYADEGRKRRRQRIQLDHQAGQATVVKQKEGEPEHREQLQIQGDALDIASAGFALRNEALEVGKTFELPIFTGKRNFPLRATVVSLETVDGPIGKRECFKIRVQTEFSGSFSSKRDTFVYLSADEGRVLVKMEADFAIGTLVAELTEYKQGRDMRQVEGSGM